MKKGNRVYEFLCEFLLQICIVIVSAFSGIFYHTEHIWLGFSLSIISFILLDIYVLFIEHHKH